MASNALVFEKMYQDYLARVAGLDLTGKQHLLGIGVDGQTVVIPFSHENFTVSPHTIADSKGGRPFTFRLT